MWCVIVMCMLIDNSGAAMSIFPYPYPYPITTNENRFVREKEMDTLDQRKEDQPGQEKKYWPRGGYALVVRLRQRKQFGLIFW